MMVPNGNSICCVLVSVTCFICALYYYCWKVLYSVGMSGKFLYSCKYFGQKRFRSNNDEVLIITTFSGLNLPILTMYSVNFSKFKVNSFSMLYVLPIIPFIL